ncbi:MAG: hypothetical protein BBJ57_06900 [Desulfobacterales bacterium PC51MH44]|nr:MAG: hypothetical protein BBJ57_06900 [Desulfobacterales bacterium PC51MH44]
MTALDTESKSTSLIDRKSFILGMMTAFAECIANECKKTALSPPFYPEDYDTLLPEAESIAKEQGTLLWYDKNLDVPEKIRLNWFVIYKFSEVLDEYKRIRNKGYNPAWNLEKFSDLLSYGTAWGVGADKVVPKIREDRFKIETFSRVLLKSGDWPIQKV